MLGLTVSGAKPELFKRYSDAFISLELKMQFENHNEATKAMLDQDRDSIIYKQWYTQLVRSRAYIMNHFDKLYNIDSAA